MANEKRLIDANALVEKLYADFERVFHNAGKKVKPEDYYIKRRSVYDADLFKVELDGFVGLVNALPTVDAVEVVRCKECRWAKPYERTDGKIGYYCHFCGHSFKYGTNWERLFTPIKESDDFCSYGERKTNEGNT